MKQKGVSFFIEKWFNDYEKNKIEAKLWQNKT